MKIKICLGIGWFYKNLKLEYNAGFYLVAAGRRV